jgi:Domain of Unknown Function with PDB structure (DUF3857)/Domain of Unknown Function with PDB structure (DUF3858)
MRLLLPLPLPVCCAIVIFVILGAPPFAASAQSFLSTSRDNCANQDFHARAPEARKKLAQGEASECEAGTLGRIEKKGSPGGATQKNKPEKKQALRASSFSNLGASPFAAQSVAALHDDQAAAKGGKTLIEKFFSDFDLSAATQQADARLRRNPHDATALFVRMETAELQEHPDLVLDSALRLCSLHADPAFQELASSRLLQHAANTKFFNSITRRLKAAAAQNNACTFNLRLALIAAATDGQPKIDLEQAARSAGLLTRWRIAGPFGNYSNLDFERRWPAEIDQLARRQYPGAFDTAKSKPFPAIAVERFWFRDGMLYLPDYFSPRGILYAAGEIDIAYAQTSQLDVLSAGTYAVFVDGKQALLQDSRYAAQASRNSAVLRLRPGHHRILVKFTADAAPLSVALHQQFGASRRSTLPQVAAQYVAVLAGYFRGDFVAMDRMLQANSGNPALAQYLHALLYSAAEEHSSRADAAWRALASAQPSALLARLKSAESAIARGQADDTRPEVMSILAERPESEGALQLAFNLSRAQTEAPALLARLLDLHPSCARLAEGVSFLSSTAQQDKASQLEQQLPACAPESLQYARTLSESGRHSAAAAWLQQLVTRNPFLRQARRMLIQELVLSNQLSAARLQAKQLHDLAPNARSYSQLALDPSSAQDSRSPRAEGFTRGQKFYTPYRRDGIELARKTAERTFSGGPVVVLLADKAIEIKADGSVSVYVHRMTRPLNKDGISRYGEIALPRSADLLELRTIKASGQVIEPELAQQKSTISMPALEPGDAIEEEYVLHYPELEQAPETAVSLTFGSFDAPILYSRLVLLSPPDFRLQVREQAGAPQPLVGGAGQTVVRIWERANISQTIAEPFLPSINLLPAVTVTAAERTRERLRDQLMDSTRAGLHVHEALSSLSFLPSTGEMERAKLLYRFVTKKIDSTGPDWAGNAAEDTLQNGQGSRTSALLALARAAGINAGLLLARKLDQKCWPDGDLSCYTEPLVRFWFAHGEIADVDAESYDLPFGAVSPTLDTREALFVPLISADEKRPQMAALAGKLTGEKSVVEGELSFNRDDLVAELDIRLGSGRAQEIRNLLRSAAPRERQAFFEQLAMRIFPGAGAVSGSAAHEDNPEQPLRILLHCTVPQFITRQSGAAEIDQLVPGLGLRTQYARAPWRKFPLYIDSLFFESTTFHLHLPPGVQVRSVPADFTEKGEFGEYSVRFVQSAQQLDIRREFRIPAQMVAPEKYAAFARFASHIDDAEHQRISLQMGKDLSALH